MKILKFKERFQGKVYKTVKKLKKKTTSKKCDVKLKKADNLEVTLEENSTNFERKSQKFLKNQLIFNKKLDFYKKSDKF